MFGTLVICLPSKHEGGAVHVRHGEETKVLETEKTSEFDTSFIAWYAHSIATSYLHFINRMELIIPQVCGRNPFG